MEPINSPRPAPRRVMDIRPQRPVMPISRPVVSPGRTTVPPQAFTQQAPPAVATPPMMATPPPAETPPSSTPEIAVPEVVQPAATKQPGPGVKAPVIAIVIAVIVAGILIALTVFAYLKTQKQDDTKQPNESDTSKVVQPEEVNDSIKTIDEELDTLNDEADFNETDISDQTLGL